MPTLSVNVNKVATLRNARGGTLPSVVEAVRTIIDAGAPGITVHPRADQRHIRRRDVLEIAEELAPLRGRVEFNVEGDPRPDLIALVLQVRPDQCTLVPVVPGEVTSQAGWAPRTPLNELSATVSTLRDAGIRVSIFVDPDREAVAWAQRLGADRVELYTEPFAQAFQAGPTTAAPVFAAYVAAAEAAHDLGLGINAGHDLDLRNLTMFHLLPHLDELSIGHALMAHALFVGLRRAVADYLAAVSGVARG